MEDLFKIGSVTLGDKSLVEIEQIASEIVFERAVDIDEEDLKGWRVMYPDKYFGEEYHTDWDEDANELGHRQVFATAAWIQKYVDAGIIEL